MNQGTLFGECQHTRTIIVPEKRGPHHAKELCADCKKFLGWLPNPETVERQKKNEEILTNLSKLENLTEWERQFIREITSHKNISPRQQEKILLLKSKYLT